MFAMLLPWNSNPTSHNEKSSMWNIVQPRVSSGTQPLVVPGNPPGYQENKKAIFLIYTDHTHLILIVQNKS